MLFSIIFDKMDVRDNLLVDNNFYHINNSLNSLNCTIIDINKKVEIILGISLFLGIVTISAMLTLILEFFKRACRSSNTRMVENFQ